MKTMPICKAFFFLTFLSVCLSLNSCAYAFLQEELREQTPPPVSQEDSPGQLAQNLPSETPKQDLKAPEYAPGVVVVKLREGAEPAVVLQEAALSAKSCSRLYPIAPAIANLKKDTKLGKDSGNWYWFLGKMLPEEENPSEEQLFQQAYAQMPKEEQGLYRTYKVELPEGTSVEEAVNQLSISPLVEYAEPNYIAKVQLVPNDPYYSSSGSWQQDYADLWGLKQMQCAAAWETKQGEGVVVAVIDTGVDYHHPDLQNNIWNNPKEIPNNGIDDDANGYVDDTMGWDFTAQKNNPIDHFGHGTHVSGTIAAEGNNAIGVIGIAPRAKIMVLKGLDDSGSGYDTVLANCVKYAADNGAKVTNNSWGGQGESQALTDAFNYAYAKGVISFAAAGNNNGDVVYFFPANIPSVVAISASTHKNEKCDFSNWGEKIELAAPGGGYDNEQGRGRGDRDNILSTMSDDAVLAFADYKVSSGYYRLAGTSMACPHAAGLAALIIGGNPGITNDLVRQILQQSADDIGNPGKDPYFGFGRLNALRALQNPQIELKTSSPENFSYLHGNNVEIIGSAFAESGFQQYELYLYPKHKPEEVTLLKTSSTAVRNGTLGSWKTQGLADQEYILGLKLTADNKNYLTTIALTLDNLSQPPEFINLPESMLVKLGESLTFILDVSDPDDPATNRGKLTCSAENLPPQATFNPQTRIFNWTPTEATKGTYTVTFTARDDEHVVKKQMMLRTFSFHYNQISTSEFFNSSPRIQGDKIIWNMADLKNRTHDYICIYDLNNQKIEDTVEINYAPNRHALYGSKIAFSQARDNKWDIWVYDMDKKEMSRITNDDYLYHQEPGELYQDKLVFMDVLFNPLKQVIFMKDLSTQKLNQITHSQFAICPDIYENKIVWLGRGDNSPDIYGIYMYDLEQKKETLIYSNYYYINLGEPVISQSKIAWVNWVVPGFPFNVGTYDLATGKQTNIGNFFTKYGPSSFSISGEKVIWQTESHIYLLDLETGQVLWLIDAEKSAFVDIDGNNIVWNRQDLNTSIYKSDVFLGKLTYSPYLISVTPQAAKPGDTLVLAGKDFGAKQEQSKAEFENGALCPIDSWSDREIRCRVPQDASSGFLKVITAGGPSNGIFVEIAGHPTPPATPENLKADVVSYSKINLSWEDKSGNEEGFKIERSPDGITFSPLCQKERDANSHQDTGLAANTKYYYRVYAFNATGNSGYSNVADATTPANIPLPPSNLVAKATSPTQIELTWQDNSDNENMFLIRRKNLTIDQQGYDTVGKVGANLTTFTDTGVYGNISYRYRVYSSIDGELLTECSSQPVDITTPEGNDPKPAAPSNLAALALSTTQVKLSWQDNSDNEGQFIIRRKNLTIDQQGYTTVGSVPADTTSWRDTTVTASTNYRYRVYASRHGELLTECSSSPVEVTLPSRKKIFRLLPIYR